MPLYEYQNKKTGGKITVSTQRDKTEMDRMVSIGLYRRIFSFSTPTTFAAVNPNDPRAEPITSKTRHRDELKRLSEEHSTRFAGMEVDYQPVDIRDPREVGVSEAGIEAAAKKARDSGKVSSPTQHFT